MVVGEMPVEKIHLVEGHYVKDRLYALHFKIVASAIVHEPAPAERRPVNDPAARNASVSEFQQLLKRRSCIAFTSAVGRSHRNAIFGHLKHIRFRSHSGRSARDSTLYNLHIRAYLRRSGA